MKKGIITLFAMAATLLLASCFSAKSASSSGRGGEVVGVSGRAFNEPSPYGMVRVKHNKALKALRAIAPK